LFSFFFFKGGILFLSWGAPSRIPLIDSSHFVEFFCEAWHCTGCPHVRAFNGLDVHRVSHFFFHPCPLYTSSFFFGLFFSNFILWLRRSISMAGDPEYPCSILLLMRYLGSSVSPPPTVCFLLFPLWNSPRLILILPGVSLSPPPHNAENFLFPSRVVSCE